MEVPPELLHRAARWGDLKRWERRELGQELRRLGLSYGKIREIIPVAKGTLSGWCRDIPLTPDQIERIRSADGGNREVARAKTGAILRQRNLERTRAIRASGREEAAALSSDPSWMAGVIAYWAEGAKSKCRLTFANSDAAMVCVFIRWARVYLAVEADRFLIRLHTHRGQDESELRKYWSSVTGLPLDQFRKGFVKPQEPDTGKTFCITEPFRSRSRAAQMPSIA